MILRLKNVHKVEAKGKVYFYHRPTKTKIKAQYGTQAFIDEVNELNGRPGKLSAKTLGSLITSYKKSDQYLGLAEVTRSDYQKCLNRVQAIRHKPLASITAGFLVKLRDRLKVGRRKKNMTLQVLSVAFSWGVERDWLAVNPALKIKAIKRPRNAPVVNRPWTARDIETVFPALPKQVSLAAKIALYTGMREGDVLRLTWSAYDGSLLTYRQSKNGDPVTIPVHSDLKAALDGADKKSPVIILGSRGKPYTEAGFRAMFFRPIRALVKAGKVEKGLTFHGLRHTIGTRLAEAGNETVTIRDVLGQRTTAMAEHYIRHANKKKSTKRGIASLERKRPKTVKPTVKPAGERDESAA